ncbi:hypothetical protein CWATWH0402_5440 [Crocosphaera watsonii WH 0402]|uniref:Uncharacterized protein n=1 Tax=Crocosphaera watsonii WH 0402 TaxID=1284629 RepID=T2JZ76_CROWT|nr:hypothetical protein CWATWH0402_5440 [Crocosphaera watsonii WH 0402]
MNNSHLGVTCSLTLFYGKNKDILFNQHKYEGINQLVLDT